MQLYWAIHHLALNKIFWFQLFFLVLSLPIFSLFTAAPNRPCGAYWSRSKLNTTQHQLVFSDRFLGCQLLSGPRNSFPETVKTCILHSDILPVGHIGPPQLQPPFNNLLFFLEIISETRSDEYLRQRYSDSQPLTLKWHEFFSGGWIFQAKFSIL